MTKVRSKRQAEEEAREEEERREYAAYVVRMEAEGYHPMHREPAILPMWKCLRCSVLAFDRAVHDAWHAEVNR